MFYLFRELWRFLSSKRKIHLMLVMILSIFAAISEMISIASVLPFLFILIGNEQSAFSNFPFDIQYLFSFFDSQNRIIILALLFVFAVTLSGLIKVLLVWMQGTFSALVGVDLSKLLLDGHLSTEFEAQSNSNTSTIIATITQKTTIVVFQIILPALAITANIIITLGIFISLYIINKEITIISFVIFGGIYSGLYIFTRKKLYNLSLITNKNLNETLRTLQEILQGSIDVLIYNVQEKYVKSFNYKNLTYRNAQAMGYVIGTSPKYIIETISICAFILIVIYSTQANGDTLETIPILGAFALAAQKLLPALHHVYQGLSSIKGSDAIFRDVLDTLNDNLMRKNLDNKPQDIKFRRHITIENASLKFKGQQSYVLKDINLKINRGDFIGISGPTGSGKSSLINMLMGFYPPSKGRVLVDGKQINKSDFRNLVKNFSYVSQNLFLCDGTIQENIAFGIATEDINHKKLKYVIKVAQLENFIQKCVNGLQTNVGELGSKISGGEKQRIAIARALYKEASIIIFDEATSALDYKTEDEIINSIIKLKGKITILAIAHRLNTLEKCDLIYGIKNGSLSLQNSRNI